LFAMTGHWQPAMSGAEMILPREHAGVCTRGGGCLPACRKKEVPYGNLVFQFASMLSQAAASCQQGDPQ
jgi:hypothetical protein